MAVFSFILFSFFFLSSNGTFLLISLEPVEISPSNFEYIFLYFLYYTVLNQYVDYTSDDVREEVGGLEEDEGTGWVRGTNGASATLSAMQNFLVLLKVLILTTK